MGAGIPGEKGARGEGVVEAAGETGLLWCSTWIQVAFSLPHSRKFPKNIFSHWSRALCGPAWPEVGKPSASITPTGPEHPAEGFPVPTNTSKKAKIVENSTILMTNVYPSFLIALQIHISLETECRGWSLSRMSPCPRSVRTPPCCEHPEAEPWQWLMPHVVTVKDIRPLSLCPRGIGFFSFKFYEYSFSYEIFDIVVPARYFNMAKKPF